MAYQLSDLISYIQKRAKDPDFDTDLITEYLNEVQNEVLEHYKLPFMRDYLDDFVSKSDVEYDMDDDVEVVYGLKLIDQTNANNETNPLFVNFPTFKDRYYDNSSAQATIPVEFTVLNKTILWSAPLDRDYKLKMTYLKTPSQLEDDDDVPHIPERFKSILVYGALSRIESYRENEDKAALFERKVEELSQDMVSRLSTPVLTRAPKARFGR